MIVPINKASALVNNARFHAIAPNKDKPVSEIVVSMAILVSIVVANLDAIQAANAKIKMVKWGFVQEKAAKILVIANKARTVVTIFAYGSLLPFIVAQNQVVVPNNHASNLMEQSRSVPSNAKHPAIVKYKVSPATKALAIP